MNTFCTGLVQVKINQTFLQSVQLLYFLSLWVITKNADLKHVYIAYFFRTWLFFLFKILSMVEQQLVPGQNYMLITGVEYFL